MTSEQEYDSQAFEYAKGKVESGEWSWEQAFKWCEQACEAFFKEEAKT
jgi:hypothetical protein